LAAVQADDSVFQMDDESHTPTKSASPTPFSTQQQQQPSKTPNKTGTVIGHFLFDYLCSSRSLCLLSVMFGAFSLRNDRCHAIYYASVNGGRATSIISPATFSSSISIKIIDCDNYCGHSAAI
jgi:hypothetical protein